MNDFAERSDRRSVWILLGLTAALILYGSLYPFRFSLPPKPFLQWELPGGLSSIRDVAINLAIYFPAGFLSYYAPRKRRGFGWRFVFAIVFAFLLSGAIEFVQAFDLGRFSSSVDLLFNVMGAAMGAAAASVLRLRFAAASWIKKNPAPLVLILFALSSYLYPFFPLVHLGPLKASFVRFGTTPITPLQVFFTAVEWLGIRILLSSLLDRNPVTLELALLGLAVPAGLVIMDQNPSPSECLGVLAALAIGHFWHPKPRQFAPLMLLDLIGRELAPFRFRTPPAAFQWIPFAGFSQTVPLAVGVVLSKFFLYGLLIWLFNPDGGRFWKVVPAVSVLLLILELGQCYLPGRTPEITDSFMALLAGVALWIVRPSFRYSS